MQSIVQTLCAVATLIGLVGAAHAALVAQEGQLYTLTNAATGNEVALFDRAADGAVTFNRFVPTGGLGTGSGLGNQGAVILTRDERFLIAVNAGSNDLSVFRVEAAGLVLVDREPARGSRPVSVTSHDDVVYVVNAGTDSISGFRLGFDGDLSFLPGSLARMRASIGAIQRPRCPGSPVSRSNRAPRRRACTRQRQHPVRAVCAPAGK